MSHNFYMDDLITVALIIDGTRYEIIDGLHRLILMQEHEYDRHQEVLRLEPEGLDEFFELRRGGRTLLTGTADELASHLRVGCATQVSVRGFCGSTVEPHDIP